MSNNDAKTRRNVLAAAAALPGLALLAAGSGAKAGGVTQANAKYRPNPNGAAQCSKCNYFLPGANATAAGKCKVVAGAIQPNGWCQLFAAKH